MDCIIIEDQLPAQRILQTYINDVPELKLLDTFSNPLEATQHLKTNKVDLIFLDINLPKLSGLSFLRNLQNPPHVILTTAYPEHALEGFELDVADYLLKPYSFERFYKAVSKVLYTGEHLTETGNQEENFVFVKSDKTVHKVEFQKIIYLKSDGDLLRIFCDNTTHIVSQTLKHWMEILPKKHFIRTHRSYIINISRIQKIRGNMIYLDRGEVPVGRQYKEAFQMMIERHC